jgi:hypothetical protein
MPTIHRLSEVVGWRAFGGADDIRDVDHYERGADEVAGGGGQAAPLRDAGYPLKVVDDAGLYRIPHVIHVPFPVS